MPRWYYMQGQQRRGPVSSEQLKAMAESGIVRPSDFVWLEGAPEWIVAARVSGLFPKEIRATEPPALPVPPPYSDREEPRRRRRRRRERRDREFDTPTLVALVIGTLLIPLIGVVVGTIGVASENSKKRIQGLVLLIVAIVLIGVYTAAVVEHDFQEEQRQQQLRRR